MEFNYWYFGLPSSSSHALIGGLIGSALVFGGLETLVFGGIQQVLIFLVVSPVLGFSVALTFGILLIYFLRKSHPEKINRVFGKLQIGSAPFFLLHMEQMMDKKLWE